MEDANRTSCQVFTCEGEPESHCRGMEMPSDGDQITGALEERCPGALSWVAKLTFCLSSEALSQPR